MNSKVVTQEEVDALMQGFDPGPEEPAPARPGAMALRPGEPVTIPLEPPQVRSRPQPFWRLGPRPIDALPLRRARPALAAAGPFVVRPRRIAVREATDYWPAYADLLSNVVLSLLFLVGIFAVGLVVLNQEVIQVQVRLAQERARALIEQRRPEPQASARAEAEPIRPAPAAPSALPPDTAPPPAAAGPATEPPVRVFTMRRPPPAPPAEGSRAAAPAAPAAPAPAPGSESAESAENAAAGAVGGRIVTRLLFDLRETVWPAGRPIVGAEKLPAEAPRALVAFAPTDNRRLMSQAFSRLSSVRSAMVASGVPARNIVLRIAPLPPTLEGDEAASSSVYVINIGGS